MLKEVITRPMVRMYSTRTAVNHNPIPKRAMKKIRIGKSRPAIYHKFNCLVELSDGSVIERRSQYPKTELRMIQDQRNNLLWNANRTDMSVVEDVRGKLYSFRQKYSEFDNTKKEEEQAAEEEEADDLLELLGANHVEKKLGGRLYDKKAK